MTVPDESAHNSTLPDGLHPVRIGSGTVVSKLGEGGVAVIYEIQAEKLGISRAVKLLKPNAGKETVDRFATEMRITAQLRHPNIVTIHAIGEWNGLPYIEMEKIDGVSLEQLIAARGALPFEVCIAIGIMVCRALAFTHHHECTVHGKKIKGILHRDLKPANIMIQNDGVVKITDFGIATPVNISLHTIEGTVVGSLQYIAPELLSGEPAGTSSDLFSLACVLYEMITGSKVFHETSMTQLVSYRMKNRFTPIQEYNVHPGRVLASIIEKNLSRDPSRRMSDANDMLGKLEKLLSRHTRYPPEEVVEFFLSANEGRIDIRRKRFKPVILTVLLVAVFGLVYAGLSLFRDMPHSAQKRMNSVLLLTLIDTLFMPQTMTRNGIDTGAVSEPVPEKESRQKTPAPDTSAPTVRATPKKPPTPPKPRSTPRKVPDEIKPKPTAPSSPPQTASNVPDVASAPVPLIDKLKQEYGTEDTVAILALEVQRGQHTRAQQVYEQMSDAHRQQVRVRLLRLRAVIATGNSALIQSLLAEEDLNDKEFYFALTKFRYEQRDYIETLLLVQRCLRAPVLLGDAREFDRGALYYKAQSYTRLFEIQRTDALKKAALNAWFDVKFDFRDQQDHLYFRKAEEEIRRIVSGGD
jgi:serine/threonine protein kinase